MSPLKTPALDYRGSAGSANGPGRDQLRRALNCNLISLGWPEFLSGAWMPVSGIVQHEIDRGFF
jgi:hypothetical protein